MSNEITTQQPFSLSGATLYASLGQSGQRWNGAALEPVSSAGWANYAVALAEVSGTAYFRGSMPPAFPVGPVDVLVYRRAGASPAPSDTLAASGRGYWDGSALTDAAVLAPAGLDAISVADPGGVSSINTLPKYLVWLVRRMGLRKSVRDVTAHTITTYADDGLTVRTTSAFADDGAGNETLGAAV